MSGAHEVRYAPGARDDLLRLFESRLDAARTAADFDAAARAIDAIETAVATHLARTPFIFRKVGTSPYLRELIVPFGSTGYLVLYQIDGNAVVHVLAVRHRREDDYH